MDTARAVIAVLKSEKYKNLMYLFLTPFDINQVPGYLDVVPKKLDLQTVEENLNSGMYATLAEFWADIFGIFENAVLYHSNQPATSWIAKIAKDMLKVVQRERNKRERSSFTSNSKKIKIRVGNTNSSADVMPPPSVSSAGAVASSLDSPPVAITETSPTEPTKKKPSLKLKLSDPSGSTTARPKLKLNLSRTSSTKELSPASELPPAGPASDSSATAVAVKPKKTGKQAPLLVTSEDTGFVGDTSAIAPAESSGVKPKAKKPKLTLKLGGVGSIGGPSRGKELPKGVVVLNKKKSPKACGATPTSASLADYSTSAVPPTASDPSIATLAAPAVSSSASVSGASSKAKKPKKSKNTNFPTEAATKVIMGLKRRQSKSISWFLQPVSEKAILADYRSKIRHPIDLQTISAKLERGSYASVATFVTDIRRIFANCLQYNTSIKDSLRPLAVEVMETAEQLMSVFLRNSPSMAASAPPGSAPPSYPPLLYCWKLCIGVLDTLYNLVNPENGQPTAYFFQYVSLIAETITNMNPILTFVACFACNPPPWVFQPVSWYCGGSFPPDYLEKIPKPMDFGTVTANLLEGKYRTCEEFCNDCRLVISNCAAYYQSREDGKTYVEHASRLNQVLSQQIEQLSRYVKSSRGLNDQAKAAAPAVLLPPPVPVLLGTLEELRALHYTDKATKITEPAMGPFERPVSLAAFPDYLQHVESPMDLQTIERKVKSRIYVTPEDFEYDVNLVFRNCELYNSRRNGDHLVAMAKSGVRQFRKLFYANMRFIEDPSSAITSPSAPDAAASSSVAIGAAPKKIKLDITAAAGAAAAATAAAGASNKAKSAPRISITAAQVSSAALNAARAKSPGNAGSKKLQQPTPLQQSQASSKADQPVPLHIAIARVKEAFPIRRPHKQLQSWEADCARYYKELMRHPWISAARPKFIFHVPVPTLFPELREAYAAKIRKPMDLTTVECTLLQGNRYTQPDDFLQDIALVFANAVRFNRDGRDIGDPLSCAYYDASVHLLRYSRWLSLEILLPYSDSSSEHVDEETTDGLPPFSWRLTEGNRKRAREEMESLVMNEPIDRSLEGDRYTWQESECEKLLKALRHQSDLKHMTFFIQANYPADYTAFIAKPMDWEKVQRTLKKRQYDKFGDIVEDLRLIFTNALKYNSRLKGTDTVSGRAYDSAIYMSSKLESAITKFLLTVSDRLERERIDHTNAERELESIEQAEEAKIREAWKNPKDGEQEVPRSSTPTSTSLMQAPAGGMPKIRLRAQRRETTTDFEIPFFDEEDNGQHERSYFEYVKFQKSLFERQRQELVRMRQCTAAIGAIVLSRHAQHQRAMRWLRKQQTNISEGQESAAKSSDFVDCRSQPNRCTEASNVSGFLGNPTREPVKLKVSVAPSRQAATVGGQKRKQAASSVLSAFASSDDEQSLNGG